MIPLRLEMLNFLPYRDPGPLDLTGLRVACLTGHNGAGKSALLDAMTWAIWGKARDGKRSDDELINFGQEEMRVALTFALGDNEYQVLRQRKAGKRGTTLLELQARAPDDGRWRGLSESTVRQTQNKINELLRLDYDTFTNSAFLMQGRADAFTLKSPGERKALLADILGLDQWDVYEQRAKDKINDLKAEARVLEREMQTIEAELARRDQYADDLASAEHARDQVAANLRAAEAELADVTQARTDLAQHRRELDGLQARIAKDQRELDEIRAELAAAQQKGDPATLALDLRETEARLAELAQVREAREQANEAATALRTEIAELEGANSAMIAEADPLKTRIELLETAPEPVCPTCGQSLSDDHRHNLVADLNRDLSDRRKRFKDNAERVATLKADLAALDRQVRQHDTALRDTSRLQTRLAETRSAISSAEEAQASIERLNAREQRWVDSIAADQVTRQDIQGRIDALSAQLNEAQHKEQAVEKLRFEHTLAEQRVGAARQRLSSLDGLQQIYVAKQAAQADVAEEIGLHDDLRVAFGKRGVPAMIIEAAVPEIEEAANELLTRMTDGRMNIRFETQREKKTGGTQETLDIQIADELGTRSYELYSGGEAFRINFAIRIALSKLLARRAGAELQTLIIDEGFGTQDAAGREHLVEAINGIQDEFERILVITHIEELKDAFPYRINVQKTDAGSVFDIF